MSLDAATKSVVEMYSKYPFPSRQFRDNFFPQFVLPTIQRLHQEYPIRRLLDAGCGTGNNTVEIASALPEVEVTAADLTDESLNLARTRVGQAKLENVRFRKTNLLEYDASLGVYDFVYCQGVIHHLSDPLAGMKNLNRYLAKDHHAFVWLYSLLGRRRIFDLREALRILGVESLPWEQRIQLAMQARPLFLSQRLTFARKVIKVLECYETKGFQGVARELSARFLRPFRGTYAGIIVADQYLHPLDKYYRFAEAVELFSGAGFEFDRVLQGMSNRLEESFGAERLLAGKNLSRLETYNLIELHEQPEGFGFLIKKLNDA